MLYDCVDYCMYRYRPQAGGLMKVLRKQAGTRRGFTLKQMAIIILRVKF